MVNILHSYPFKHNRGFPSHHVQVFGSKRLNCNADFLTIRCSTRGECEGRAGKEAHKRGIHSGFETKGRFHRKSKTKVPVAPQKGLVFSKNLKEKNIYLQCKDDNHPNQLSRICSVHIPYSCLFPLWNSSSFPPRSCLVPQNISVEKKTTKVLKVPKNINMVLTHILK